MFELARWSGTGLLLRSLEPLWRRPGQETMLPALCAEPWLQPPSARSTVVRRAFDRREREKETAREGDREREKKCHCHPCALHRTGMRNVPRTVHRLTVTGQLNLQSWLSAEMQCAMGHARVLRVGLPFAGPYIAGSPLAGSTKCPVARLAL